MESIAILTIKQSEYNSLLSTLKAFKIEPISITILPDDSELRQTDDIYNCMVKQQSDLSKKLREYRHNKLINKTK